MTSLTHIDATGSAAMVDISGKPAQTREAVAQGRIVMAPATIQLIRDNGMKKGDVLAVARIAGIQAAKQTQMLIPLCHQIPLSKVTVDFAVEEGAIAIRTTAKTVAPTGVEMEALTAATLAALTIYDMCKAVDKAMVVTDVKLVSKTKSSEPS